MKDTQFVNIYRKYPGKKLRRTPSLEGLRSFRARRRRAKKAKAGQGQILHQMWSNYNLYVAWNSAV